MTVREMIDLPGTLPRRREQGMIDYSKFRSSLKRLEEQHGNYRQGNPALSDLDREGIAESVIQRFETCYDCLWKVQPQAHLQAGPRERPVRRARAAVVPIRPRRYVP